MKNKKIIPLKKLRNKKNLKKFLSLLIVPAVLIVVGLAFLISARILGNVAVSNTIDGLRSVGTLFSDGEGFPYTLGEENISKIEMIGNRILILSEEKSTDLAYKAGKWFENQVTSPDAKVITQNGRAQIFSSGSDKVILHSKTEQLGTVTADGRVITATLGYNGWFATSHTGEESQSVLTVYNNHFEKEFQWNCSNERISAIALSKNGKKVAVAAIGVKDAEIYTRIIIFNTDETKAVKDAKYSGTMFLKLVWSNSDAIFAVGDDRMLVFDENGENTGTLAYGDQNLYSVKYDDKGNIAVCRTDLGGAKTYITVYNKDGTKACEKTFEGTVTDMDIDKNRFAVLKGGTITVNDLEGEEKETKTTESNATQLMLKSGKCYTVESGKICKY